MVDDEPDMLDFLERSLRRRFEVVRCSASTEALDLLLTGGFQLVVTDQMMPRLSGLALLEQLDDRCRGLARVLLSGYSELPAVQRALERGLLDAYVLKPVDGVTLLAAIEAAQARRG